MEWSHFMLQLGDSIPLFPYPRASQKMGPLQWPRGKGPPSVDPFLTLSLRLWCSHGLGWNGWVGGSFPGNGAPWPWGWGFQVVPWMSRTPKKSWFLVRESFPKSLSSSLGIIVLILKKITLKPFGEMIQFEEHIFELGWNHQLDLVHG